MSGFDTLLPLSLHLSFPADFLSLPPFKSLILCSALLILSSFLLPFLSLCSSLFLLLYLPFPSLPLSTPFFTSILSLCYLICFSILSPAFSLSISPLAFPSLSSSSWIVTRLGGFFIKRRLDSSSGKDVLYRKCLHEVIQLI